MKNKFLLILGIVLCVSQVFISCEEEEGHGPLNPDGTKPGPVSSLVATPTQGGAILSYNLPNDKDLAGVRVDYVLPSGEKASSSASLYTNQLFIVGLLNVEEVTVSVIAFDNSGNDSEPVSIAFTPLLGPVLSAASSLEILPDFGGARYTFSNESGAALDLFVFLQETGEEVLLLSTKSYDGEEALSTFTERGFDTEERVFMGLFRDRWGNFSDTIKVALEPGFEELIPKENMAQYRLPHDVPLFGGSGPDAEPSHGLWTPERFFDDIIDLVGPSGFRTLDGAGSDEFDPEPTPEYVDQFDPTRVTAHIFTMDLGVSASLSRFTYHPLTSGYFSLGGWRIFDVWGTNETPNPDGSFDGWTRLLEDVEVVTPPNHIQRKDEIITEGVEFLFDSQEMRYIRFAWRENYTPIKSFNANEITFYGKIIQ